MLSRWFRVRFWSSIWCGDISLEEFLDLYTLVVNKEALVAPYLANPNEGEIRHWSPLYSGFFGLGAGISCFFF